MTDKKANIALIGAGWWSQGWHLPCLDRNEEANLVAIVDTSSHPKSNLNPDLESLETLKHKYNTQIYSSISELLNEMGPELDGVLIATPHATHYAIGKVFMEEIDRRKEQGEAKPLHILMEKPMSTDVQHSLLLYKLVKDHAGPSQFWVNHSANFRTQAKMAREAISSGRIGKIRHITGFFASPLMWIFDDPSNKGWNEPTGGMLGNGFAWGQISHLLAWIYHVCPNLQPVDVYCNMVHSEKTGADVSLSATIRCYDGSNSKELAVMNVSGTSLLPGNAHSEPQIGKVAEIKIFGTEGSLLFGGDDREPNSGRLELRRPDGSTEVLHENFHFENLDAEGLGPESLQNFVQLCCGSKDVVYAGANVMDGLRSIQTIDAMYRSHDSSGPVNVKLSE